MNTPKHVVDKADFIRKALAKYPVHQTITSKSNQRNLPEMISRYPKYGKGFKVFKKTWPEDHFWQIYHVVPGTKKSAKIYGIMYKDGERISNNIDKIHGVHKRGIWQYDINGAFEMADVEDMKPSQLNEAQEAAEEQVTESKEEVADEKQDQEEK